MFYLSLFVSNNLSLYIEQNFIPYTFRGDDIWVVLTPIEQSIKKKIETVGTPLKNWNIQINYGIKTGCNKAFIISTEKREQILANCKTEEERNKTADIIRPILRGRDIKRYSYNWANLWLIATFPSKGYNIDDYPAIKEYLLGFGKKRLEQTGKTYTEEGKTIKARKKTSNKWFEVQDSIAYWEEFYKPKIIYAEIVQSPRFYLDSEGEFYPEATTFILTGEFIDYLINALHSKILSYCFKHFYSGGGLSEDGYRYKKIFLLSLPIPHPMNYPTLLNMTEENSDELLKDVLQLSEEEMDTINSK